MLRQPAALLLVLAGSLSAGAQATTQDSQTPRPARAATGATGVSGTTGARFPRAASGSTGAATRGVQPVPVTRVAPAAHGATGAVGARAASGATGSTHSAATAHTGAATAPREVTVKPRTGETVSVPGEAHVVIKNGEAVSFPAGARPRTQASKTADQNTGVAVGTAKTQSAASTSRGEDSEAERPATAPRPVQKLAGAAAATGATGAHAPSVTHPAGSTGSSGLLHSAGSTGQHPASGATGSTGSTGRTKALGLTAGTGSSGSTGAPGTPTKAPAASANAVTQPQPATPAGPPTGPLNRTTIVLDPGHGGPDGGSRIGDNLLEKDVTLQFAFRLRSLLQARGFTVVMTREADAAMQPSQSATPLTLDDRAGIANHARAVACLLLHATGRGSGVHLYRSDLDPVNGEQANLPWLTAQAAWVSASNGLNRELAQALGKSKVPLVTSVASIRPVDSLTCPALVLELAPEDSDTPESINGANYQNRVAAAVAGVMIFWQNNMQPPIKIIPPPAPKKKAAPADDEDDSATLTKHPTAGAGQ